MTPRVVSPVRQRAEAMSDGSSLVRGPLKGYHHETYVLSPPGGVVVKLREPRSTSLWFDRRCFQSEEDLLRGLRGRIDRVPDVVDVEGMGLQTFIEGRTLGAHRRRVRQVPDAVFEQIVGLFRQLTRITAGTLNVPRRCSPEDAPDDGDTDAFLKRLVVFVGEQVYEANRPVFGGLFADLGVRDEALVHLEKHVAGLTPRPFCLLHGDLHRENFVVDPRGGLWTIDWELAMVGDPLYDLATHLYLMRYPADQEARMIRAWCEAVEAVRPGSSRAWEHDLPLLTGFKRAQSLYTDTVRAALSLRGRTGLRWTALPRVAAKLQSTLAAAAAPLGLTAVPGHREVATALLRWHRETAALPTE
ncbi:aminoglycoside phosphotransferase family protein [Streptomyces olivaceus]|uniref:aminoglycoside phosphotransferase family protein n=2 Tax=Streptomyces TaxID=1883 RepID=UPI00055D8287|nr:aminoglycoside phosphotransferase family protein [Streptomyces olivaceus]MBZ6110886.1 aminoglycoside phosphotransferase family protein [Streptomyces olivaceus]MBZ6126253.1 aminoglycoside phosphotransferase family protein [Streptomyces olivaceus]MBZ6145223.1 aminoglycoside phosphotransferase family protein [Streptomyces olivaceus]MBZ6159771.1 aminoglycoside phosphotransferase family protein [Streptomyces olivaceus]MBZ6187550.1 aminoglycoside phosphotransferase family protein [Streptomyces ol